MREEIARYLRTYKLGEEEGYVGDCIAPWYVGDCITPWEDCNQFVKNHWLADADQLLALTTVRVERLTDEESLALRIEWNKGLSKCDCWGDFVAQAQIAKIKRLNPGINFKEE